MTRLQSHKQKQFFTKLVFFIICLVVLVVVLVFVGLKLLINATIFVSNVGNKPTTQATDNNQAFFGDVTISDIPESTNSAEIIVTGSSSNFDTLEFYINDDVVKHIDVSSSDAFSEQIGDLKKGKNEVYVKAKSKDKKNTKDSEKFSVIYTTEKPKLELTDPQDNSTVYKPDISVAGNTNPGNSLKVNGAPGVVESSGHFSYPMTLKEGDNKIDIMVMDDSGNSDQKSITVKYQRE